MLQIIIMLNVVNEKKLDANIAIINIFTVGNRGKFILHLFIFLFTGRLKKNQMSFNNIINYNYT